MQKSQIKVHRNEQWLASKINSIGSVFYTDPFTVTDDGWRGWQVIRSITSRQRGHFSDVLYNYKALSSFI